MTDTDSRRDDVGTGLPGVANPTCESRRFRIIGDDGTVEAHGVVFPPPTCTTVVQWHDGVQESSRELADVLDKYGEKVTFVDKTTEELRTNHAEGAAAADD